MRPQRPSQHKKGSWIKAQGAKKRFVDPTTNAPFSYWLYVLPVEMLFFFGKLNKKLRAFACPAIAFKRRRMPLWRILKGSEGSAIRTLPIYATTGKAPEIFFHTIITDLKSAGTCPAEWLVFATTTTYKFFLPTNFVFIPGHGQIRIADSLYLCDRSIIEIGLS